MKTSELQGLRRAVEDRLRKGTPGEILEIARVLGIEFLADGREENGYARSIPDQDCIDLEALVSEGSIIEIEVETRNHRWGSLWGFGKPDERGRYILCTC